jgi:hypothetical protein
MPNLADLLERESRTVDLQPGDFDRLVRRRDRKRRNQRIAAGVVGIALFVAAVWIVTSGLSLDRSKRSVAPAGEVTGPAETGPAETAPPLAQAGEPDEVTTVRCGGSVTARLALHDVGDGVTLRFALHGSAPDHSWGIRILRIHLLRGNVIVFRGTRVASDDGDLAVRRSFWDNNLGGFRVRARDRQTGQICGASIG